MIRLVKRLALGVYLLWLLLAGGVVGATAPSTVPTSTSATPEAVRADDPANSHWEQVKRLMERRAYREAVEELTIISTLHPNDPRAAAYRRICEKRLSATGQFGHLSPEGFKELEASLRQEELAQRRETAQNRALQREVEREQARWEAEVKRQVQQILRDNKQQERQAKLQAKQREHVMQEKIREATRLQHAKPSAPQPAQALQPPPASPQPAPFAQEPSQASQPTRAPQPPSPSSQPPSPTPIQETPEAEHKAAAPSSQAAHPSEVVSVPISTPASSAKEEPSTTPQPSATPPSALASSKKVELERVTVPTAPPETAEPLLTLPTPEPSAVATEPPPKRPPGAVQIFAEHMDVSPERRLAKAEGDVRLVFDDGVLTCDKLTLFTDTKDAYAEGHVRLEKKIVKRGHTNTAPQPERGQPKSEENQQEIIQGELMHYNLSTKKGRALQGDAYIPPWYEHGRVVENLAEGVMYVKPGYLTSCEFDPPHFRLQGKQSVVFSEDRLARGRDVTVWAESFPIASLPWASVSDHQSPFFIVPGKRKPWGPFALMGYRYEWPPGNRGTLRLDWRRYFLWGFGVDDQFQTGHSKGLVKLYYNNRGNLRVKDPKATLPKGAALKRYRVLFRHTWQLLPDTQVVTDIQKFNDEDFRKDFLFREEYIKGNAPESFISFVSSNPNYSLNVLLKRRMNRFQTVTEAYPDATLDTKTQRIGKSNLFTASKLGFANLQIKNAHSGLDTDVVRVDWLQRLSYAWNLFRPILLTPNVGVRQTYYAEDKQDGLERPNRIRNLFSGQFSSGVDANLTLFRIFPVMTNWLGLNINQLRHVLTPSLSYSYIHPPTIPNNLLSLPAADAAQNQVTFEIANTLQTKRPGKDHKLQSADIARLVVDVPYSFRGINNKQGGRLGDWTCKLEIYPWPWFRLESNLPLPSHFVAGTRDSYIQTWNLDLVMVGGRGNPSAQYAPGIQAPAPRTEFRPGPRYASGLPLLPQGEWYVGLGHRYSQNDKTEDVLQFDWRLSEKWQISTFHRFTWKEVVESFKRFNNLREYQYTLTRDLHDWVAEVVYRVDREFGEELFFTMTLKAYPGMPIKTKDSYHQPKFGSQSSPFSPLRGESPSPSP